MCREKRVSVSILLIYEKSGCLTLKSVIKSFRNAPPALVSEKRVLILAVLPRRVQLRL